MRTARRVLLAGFDGATWDLLARYAEDGTMPTLQNLLASSRWGDLRSTVPPVTAPAWAALSTGMNPGKSGVFSFHLPVESIVQFRATTSSDVRAPTLPELLERSGLKVQVVNLPTFSYPKKIEGAVLGDILCPPEQAVQPPELRGKEPFKSYRTFPNMSLKHDLPSYIQDIRDLERTRFECAKELLRGAWDFMFVMFSGTDWVQHELYGDLLHGLKSRAVSAAEGLYHDLDSYLDWFVSRLGPDDYFGLVSDHGFQVSPGAFDINRWLLREGYLRQQGGLSGGANLASRISVEVPSPIVAAVSRRPRLWRIAVGAWRSLSGGASLAGNLRPDPAATVAFSQDYSWGVRLNSKRRLKAGILGEAEEARVLSELRKKFDALAASGIIEKCLPAGEVYSGPHVRDAPDLILFPRHRSISVPGRSIVDDLPRNGHSMDGLFLLRGRGFSPKGREAARIYDITPTILTLFGLGVPSDVDGESLVGGAKSEGATSQEQTEPLSLSSEEEAIVEERLRSLGYV